MIRVGIVADDLTGACDTAVQFVRAGWQTELQIRQRRTRADVIAVSTASRAMPEDKAADAVRRAVEGLRAAGVTRLYKKIDSTPRWNAGLRLPLPWCVRHFRLQAAW